MGKGVVINDANLKRKVRRDVEKWSKRAIKPGMEITKNVRETSIDNWYKKFKGNPFKHPDSTTMKESIEYGHYEHWHGDTVRYVIFYSGVNKDKYKMPESLNRQRDKYTDIADYRSYVIGLQLNDAILGLPEYFSHKNGEEVTPYKNPRFGETKYSLYEYNKRSFKYTFDGKFRSAMKVRWNNK